MKTKKQLYDIKGVIRSRKSKDRQYSGQMKKRQNLPTQCYTEN